ATINSTADGLLVVDRSGRVVTHNQRFLALWRIPRDLAKENDDQRLLSFVYDQLEDPDEFIRGTEELYNHAERESFEVLHFKDGRVFERYSKPQRIGDQVVGRVWSFHDVTERETLLRRALFLADATRLLSSLDVEPALDSVAHLAVPYMGDVCAVDLLGSGGPPRPLLVSPDPSPPVNPGLHRSVLAGHAALYSLRSRSSLISPLVPSP